MASKVILHTLFLAEIVLALSSRVKLYNTARNTFAGKQGYVLYSDDLEAISFVSGSSWNYGAAVVVCRGLGEFD